MGYVQRTDSANWGTPTKDIWRAKKSSEEDYTKDYTTPLVDGNKMIIAYDNFVQCVSKDSGNSIWVTSLTSPSHHDWVSKDFIHDGEKLFVAGADRQVACLDFNTGAIIWNTTLEGILERDFSQASQTQDALFVATIRPTRVLAISKATGEILWQTNPLPVNRQEIKGPRMACPTVVNGTVYVPFSCGSLTPGLIWDGGYTAFNAESGKRMFDMVLPPADSTVDHPMWKDMKFNGVEVGIVPYNNNSLILTTTNLVVKTDLAGKIEWWKGVNWNLNISPYTSPVMVYANAIYGFNSGQRLAFGFALDAETGTVLWKNRLAVKNELNTVTFFRPFVNDEAVYQITDADWLYRLNIHTGQIEAAVNMEPHSPSDKGGTMHNGCLYAEGKRVYALGFKYMFCHELQIP